MTANEPFVIRPLRTSDAPAIHRIRLHPLVLRNIVSTPAEPLSRTRLTLQTTSDSAHSFVAEVPGGSAKDGQVIGIATLMLVPFGAKRHTASFGIMVDPAYHGQGVGTRLLQAILDLADNHLRLKRVELTVYADNEGAIRLYERFGFAHACRLRGDTKRAGHYADALSMARTRPISENPAHPAPVC